MNNEGMSNQQCMDILVANARKALEELSKLSQEKIDELCRACSYEIRAYAEEFANEAVEETGMGDVPSKIAKISGTPVGVWYALKGKKSIGIIKRDDEKGLTYVAHPKGIISCVIPTTNPNMTVIVNGIYALKGANVIICSPHPRAKKSTVHTITALNKILKEHGAPDNIFQCIEYPNMELTHLLMSTSDTVLGTGGASMVQAAYSSGKPAYGVGPGNSHAVFDPDYDDIPGAVAKTIGSNCFDNGIVCACPRAFVTPQAVSQRVVDLLKKNHVFYVEDAETRDKLRDLLFPNGYGKIGGDAVGQSVQKIAEMAGIKIPADTSIIVVKVEKYGLDEPLCREKMMPVGIHIVCENLKEAIEIVRKDLFAEGAGHSSIIHSNNKGFIEYAALHLPVSRILVNTIGQASANAMLDNSLIPTSTLGCGSWAGCSISENLTYMHLINVSRIAYPLPPDKVPTEDEVWNGSHIFEGDDLAGI
jgi:succinate-semialdehyde dehydrogenase